jgi:hypothetical protein
MSGRPLDESRSSTTRFVCEEPVDGWANVLQDVQLDVIEHMIEHVVCDLLTGQAQRVAIANDVIDDPVQFGAIENHRLEPTAFSSIRPRRRSGHHH